MPSPEHAADLERVLTRAAQECESGAAWFGEGLPQALRSAIEATGKTVDECSADVAFIEFGTRTTPVSPPRGTRRVIALSSGGLDSLRSLVRSAESSRLSVSRLICPVGVFDFGPGGLRVREIRHGLTAADLQRALDTTLWSGPDLKEL